MLTDVSATVSGSALGTFILFLALLVIGLTILYLMVLGATGQPKSFFRG